jgi:quercetin dioxygenase-like cupin family protein
MKVVHYTEVKPEVYGEGVTLRWVVSEADGAPHFAMRVIEVQPGAATQLHTHWWEHEVFVLDGKGHAVSDDGDRPIGTGTVLYIPGDEKHQLVNDGQGVLRFICLIPHPKLKGFAEAGLEAEIPNQC